MTKPYLFAEAGFQNQLVSMGDRLKHHMFIFYHTLRTISSIKAFVRLQYRLLLMRSTTVIHQSAALSNGWELSCEIDMHRSVKAGIKESMQENSEVITW